MLYGTGGVAFTHQNFSGFLQSNSPGIAPYSTSSNKTGWVAGLGVERIMAAHWMLRLEWLHYNFGGATVADLCGASVAKLGRSRAARTGLLLFHPPLEAEGRAPEARGVG